MILKTLQSMVPEFPKLEPGDPGTRARRLQQWRLQITQALEPAGPHVSSWWNWVCDSAEKAHQLFTTQPLDRREQIYPRDPVPTQFVQLESWMRPRILGCLPKNQREWVDLRAQTGAVDPSNVLVFYLYKFFAPGSPGEKDGLLRRVLNPNVCTNPAAAQIELMRWRADVRRLRSLDCLPPDLMMSYRAMESIFGMVFDRAEPQLHLRWVSLKNKLGLPHVITPEAFVEVSEFADAELSALVLLGGSALNPGLPLTDNQKARLQNIKEGEKRRAAKMTAAAATTPTRSTPALPSFAARLSSSLSTWAPDCNHWKEGECKRGVACRYAHPGFPVEEQRCFICKSTAHSSKECTCPGGGADPNKDKVWEEYRERRKAAETAGKGDHKGGGKGKNKGIGKGKAGKGSDGGRATAKAKACVDPARAAAAATAHKPFPKGCVALDSWANVWLQHQKNKPDSYYQDTLHLAYGECQCHKETADKLSLIHI